MALEDNIADRELDKFETTEDDLTAVRIKDFSGLFNGIVYDFIDIQQTSATIETFVFKTGGSGGTIVTTITIVYTDATKNDLDTVTRT